MSRTTAISVSGPGTKKSLSQTEKTEFDERYSATLYPALQMRNAYRNIRDTIKDHKTALANRSIVRKSVGPEPLLTERIDTQLRNSTNLFLEMAHQALQGIPVTMKFFKINIDFLMDNEKRFAIGCEKYEAKIPEVVAYLRKLRPIWIDLNEQFKKQRFGSWTLPAVRYESHDNVVTMSSLPEPPAPAAKIDFRGQSLRCPSVPAPSGYGANELMHTMDLSSKEAAKTLVVVYFGYTTSPASRTKLGRSPM